MDSKCPWSSSGDQTTSRTNRLGIPLQHWSEESVAPFKTASVHSHHTSSLAVIYILSKVNSHCLKTWTKLTPRQNVGVCVFFPSPFPGLVVDLCDSSFAATTLHQLVDGALAVPLKLVQVLIEDLAWTQRGDQVVKLPVGFVWRAAFLGPPFPFPLLLELKRRREGRINVSFTDMFKTLSADCDW